MTTTSRTPPTDLLGEYRSGLEHGQLRLPRCRNCSRLQFPPRLTCPNCHTVDDWEMAEVSGRGTVWSYVVFHKRYLEDGPETPYDVTVVELEEGPRVFGRVLGDARPQIGAAVQAAYEGRVLCFTERDAG
jgi:uncharacterized OB-fold protein